MTSLKRKSLIIGSRLQERDKKNMEYYGGDYSEYKIAKKCSFTFTI